VMDGPRIIEVNGVGLCVDTTGDAADPAILLIGGMGAAMDWWEEEFCRAGPLAGLGRTGGGDRLPHRLRAAPGVGGILRRGARAREALAREIPRATLLPLAGVGHQMPPRPCWTSVIAAMLRGA